MARNNRNNKGRRASGNQQPVVSKKRIQEPALPTILRDSEAARKLFEVILESPSGKRSLSRLARTCRAMSEPALNVLWRDLDSIVPLLGLFPNTILKKAKRPGMGLAETPEEADWDVFMKYSGRVRRIAYDEIVNNVASSVFPILDEHRPCLYIIPHLQEIVWKAETPAGLERCSMFLTPEIRHVQLEVGANFKKTQVAAFLADMSSRSLLTSFSLTSPTALPDSFTELLMRQDRLEKVVLTAPGALGSGVGRWVATLPALKSLELDLTGRSPIAVEGFFDEIRPRSGSSTPSSVCSTDSGIFSGEELDFAELRKSALQFTGRYPSRTSFAQLKRVQLTGEVGNISVFLKHLSSPVAHLELVIEDPPDYADWQDLSVLICEAFSDTLQSMRITATSASRFADLVRSTSRADTPTRLSLENFTDLNRLTHFEIDLPESIAFLPQDLEALALACPRLEVLRLCPLARFPATSSGPGITLENISTLTRRCKHLHTIAAVVNASEGTPSIMEAACFASPSLVRLHMGHSWIGDPLQVSILLSHLAPHLENLRWFQEKNRPGFNEVHSRNWQTVLETLPHIQRLRSLERSFAHVPTVRHPKTANVGVDATPVMVSRGVAAEAPKTVSEGIQCVPILISRSIDAVKVSVSTEVDATPQTCEVEIEVKPAMCEMAIDATPPMCEMAIDATPPMHEMAVDATPPMCDVGTEVKPLMVSTEVDATPRFISQVVDATESSEVLTAPSPTERSRRILSSQVLSQLYLIPSIVGFFSFLFRYLTTMRMSAMSSNIGLRLLTFKENPFFANNRSQVSAAGDATPPDCKDITMELESFPL